MKKEWMASSSSDENSIFPKNQIFLVILLLILLINISFISATEYQVKVTEEHPFYVNNKWISASELKVGDKLTTIDGKTATITKLTQVHSDEPISVYNLEALPFNDFVIAGNVVVHNSGGIESFSDIELRLRKGKEYWTEAEIKRINDAEKTIGRELKPEEKIQLLLAHYDPVGRDNLVSQVWRLSDAGFSRDEILALGDKRIFGESNIVEETLQEMDTTFTETGNKEMLDKIAKHNKGEKKLSDNELRSLEAEFMSRNSGLIATIANKYSKSLCSVLSKEDFKQDAALGMLKALRKWNPENPDKKFSDYVWYWMKGRILNDISRTATLKLSKEMKFDINNAIKSLKESLKREPTDEEITKFLKERGSGSGKIDYEKALKAYRQQRSLDSIFYDYKTSMQDAENCIPNQVAKEEILKFISSSDLLDNSGKKIIELYLQSYKTSEIAEKLGITSASIRKRINKDLKSLRFVLDYYPNNKENVINALEKIPLTKIEKSIFKLYLGIDSKKMSFKEIADSSYLDKDYTPEYIREIFKGVSDKIAEKLNIVEQLEKPLGY